MANYEVNWTGSWPALCMGAWVIFKDGVNISDAIPEEKRENHMNTFGTYSSWHFEHWEEVWEDYEDGLKFEEWVAENPWINAICDSDTEKLQLFEAISKCDWRHSSCGGCI